MIVAMGEKRKMENDFLVRRIIILGILAIFYNQNDTNMRSTLSGQNYICVAPVTYVWKHRVGR